MSDPLTADDRGHVEFTFTGVGPLPAGTYQAAAVEGSNRAMIARINTNVAVAETPVELPCPTPRIALHPDCAPAGASQDRYDVTVSGTGFRYGSAVLTWDVGGSDEEFPIEEVGDNGVFSVRVAPRQRAQGSRIRVRVMQTFPLEAGSGANDPLLGPAATASAPPRVARATFRVPCRPTETPVLTLDPDCDTPALVGDAERRYAIGVSASGLVPGPVDIVFDAGAAAADVTPPEHFPGDVGKDGRLSPVTLTPLARPIGEYRLSLLQSVRPPSSSRRSRCRASNPPQWCDRCSRHAARSHRDGQTATPSGSVGAGSTPARSSSRSIRRAPPRPSPPRLASTARSMCRSWYRPGSW